MLAIVLVAIASVAVDLPGAAEYTAARDAERARRFDLAVAAYEQCVEAGGPLAAYAGVGIARCRAAASDRAGAEKRYRAVLDDGPAGPWQRMARAELAALLARSKRRAEAHALYNEVIGPPVALWWFDDVRWAAAANAVAEPDYRDEGYATFAALAESAWSRWKRLDAAKHLARSPDPDHRLAAADAFLITDDYRDAAKVLAWLLPTLLADDADRQARWQFLQGRCQLGVGQVNQGRDRLRYTAEQYPGTEWAAPALAHLARSLYRGGKHTEGAAVLDALLSGYPESEAAGDALWWVAGCLKDQERPDDALAMYRRLGDACPGHARGGAALLAVAAAEEPAEALKTCARILELYPGTEFPAEATCRSGAIHEALGEPAEAIKDYEAAAQGPIGDYHAHRALARLHALGPAPAENGKGIPAGLAHPVVRPAALDIPPVAVAPASWLEQDWYRRLRFFGGLGFEEAEWELLDLAGRLDALAEEGPIYQVLGEAGLAASAADFLAASGAGPADGPGEDAEAITRLRALYPRAYWLDISALARETGLDPYLLLAVGRQESTFRARVASHVGAAGVMQLMPATAAWLAKIEDAIEPAHARDLERPAHSIRLGAYYLMRMLERFDGNVVYALAAYNGGPGNVSKWRRRYRTDDMAAFIDAIPFRETRGFVRNVLGNYAAYRSLYPDAPAQPNGLEPPD
ncbi:MAG: transglycosylase SLT domain-containing protein [Candidatus Hydrogenedentes bacterium]|nr:transglycosylase SLT domain-containing protein [Candidatus Hydrogenedentota bacterium]